MNRELQQTNYWYDKLMFASTRAEAQRAARELVRLVLGETAEGMPIEESLKEVCRELRPARDEKEQARFEAEFLELLTSPTGGRHSMIAA